MASESDENTKDKSEVATDQSEVAEEVSGKASELKNAALASFGTVFKKSKQEIEKDAEIAALKKKTKKKTKDASELFKAMSAGSKKSDQEIAKDREMAALKGRKKKKIKSASELWSNDAGAATSPRAAQGQRQAATGELEHLRRARQHSQEDMSFLGKGKAQEQSTQGSQTANELAALKKKRGPRAKDFLAVKDATSSQGAQTAEEMLALKKKSKKSLDFLTRGRGPSVQGKQALKDIQRMAKKKSAKENGLDFLTRQPSNGQRLWEKARKSLTGKTRGLTTRAAMLSQFRKAGKKRTTSKQGQLAEREKARLAASEDDQLAYLEGDAVFEALSKLLARQSPKRRVETLLNNELVVKPHQGHYQGFTQKAYFALVNTPYSTATPQQQGRKVSAVLRDKQAKDLSWRHVMYIFKSPAALKDFQTGMAKYAYHKGKCRASILANTMNDLYIPLTDARVEILPAGDPRLVERDPASKLPHFEFFVTIPDPEDNEGPSHRYNFLAYSEQDRNLWVNAIKQAAADDETQIQQEDEESSRPARLKRHVNSLQSQLSASARRTLTLSGERCVRFAQSTIPCHLECRYYSRKAAARTSLQHHLRKWGIRRRGCVNEERGRLLRDRDLLRDTCQARLRSNGLRHSELLPAIVQKRREMVRYRFALRGQRRVLLEWVLEQKRQRVRDRFTAIRERNTLLVWSREQMRRRVLERATSAPLRGQFLGKRQQCRILQAALATAQGLPAFIKRLHEQKVEARKRAVAEAREKWRNIDRDWEAGRRRKVDEWAQAAGRGATFAKYPATSKGAPADRGVAVVGGKDGCVVWYKPGKPVPQGLQPSAKNCFRVAAIKDVTAGRSATAFAQNSKGKHAANLCFSINYGARTLDLAAKSAADYQLWMGAFDVLLNRDSKPQKGPDPDTVIPPVREPHLSRPMGRGRGRAGAKSAIQPSEI